jgi:hypothetical protein
LKGFFNSLLRLWTPRLLPSGDESDSYKGS